MSLKYEPLNLTPRPYSMNPKPSPLIPDPQTPNTRSSWWCRGAPNTYIPLPRDPKPEIRNPKPETQNSKPETEKKKRNVFFFDPEAPLVLCNGV